MKPEKPREYLLNTKMGSQVYIELLKAAGNKISGYEICKRIYGDKSSLGFQGKVNQLLHEMVDEKLITIVSKPTGKRPKNMFECKIESLIDILVAETSIDRTDMKFLVGKFISLLRTKNLLSFTITDEKLNKNVNDNLEKMENLKKTQKNLGFLDWFKFILCQNSVIALTSNKIWTNNMENRLKTILSQEIIEFMKEFFKLKDNTLIKLSKIQPTLLSE